MSDTSAAHAYHRQLLRDIEALIERKLARCLPPVMPLHLTAVAGGADTPVVGVSPLEALTADLLLAQHAEKLASVMEERDALVTKLLASQDRVRELEEERDRSQRNYADLEHTVLARGYTLTWTLESDPEAPLLRLEPAFALSPELAIEAADKRASAAERKVAAAEARVTQLERVRDNLCATRDRQADIIEGSRARVHELEDAIGKASERAEEDRRRLTALSNAIVGMGYDLAWDLRAGELPSIRLTSRWERWP
ncbi:MAG TPA: hypothetical protein VFL91_08260 [Thermomicrobiales bacterium]|nr:hypothetical protein [Thermomicrobiales bacterium]